MYKIYRFMHIHVHALLLKICIYLNSLNCRDKKRDTERSFKCWFTPQTTTRANTGPDESQELGSPRRDQTSKYLSHLLPLFTGYCRRLGQKWGSWETNTSTPYNASTTLTHSATSTWQFKFSGYVGIKSRRNFKYSWQNRRKHINAF